MLVGLFDLCVYLLFWLGCLVYLVLFVGCVSDLFVCFGFVVDVGFVGLALICVFLLCAFGEFYCDYLLFTCLYWLC